MIQAQVIAHSKNSITDMEIISMVIEFPRYILAEAKTHRILSGLEGQIEISESIGFNDDIMLSKNSASSRAIPFQKMLDRIITDPFIPIAWQKEHKGMQGSAYFTDPEYIDSLQKNWLLARDFAIQEAQIMNGFGVTKQIVNRIIENYTWHRVIVTATEWENFFSLRCPQYYFPSKSLDRFRSKKDVIKAIPDIEATVSSFTTLDWLKYNEGQAEIHMMALAEAMWDAMKASTPKILKPGEWHIPFGDQIDEERLTKDLYRINEDKFLVNNSIINQAKIEIATSRCARTSYFNYEGKDDYESDFRLFKQLKTSPIHASPFEHCAITMGENELDDYAKIEAGSTDVGWCRNFKGFIQYRSLID